MTTRDDLTAVIKRADPHYPAVMAHGITHQPGPPSWTGRLRLFRVAPGATPECASGGRASGAVACDANGLTEYYATR